jgi:hypothetical protein
MSIQVELDTDGVLLLAVVKGTVTSFDASWQVLKQICDTALEKHLNRILIDGLELQGVATTIDRYTMGVTLVAYCGEHQFWPRVAFVGEPPVVDGFGVLVAGNRGMATETFSNRKEALEWLHAASK